MTLGYYLTIDQSILFNGNFSDSLTITGTCYSDVGKTVTFNLTGYTLTLKLHKEDSSADWYNQTCSITTAVSGTWNEAVSSGTLPTAGLYLVDLVLTKSGTQISNLNRIELLIQRGPQ